MTGSRPTLQTIADTVGVSRTTVSNAYNRPDQLAPALRERIFITARRLGYAGPDPAARRLRSGTRDAVGVLLGGGLDSGFGEAAPVLRGIARALEAAGLGLLLVPANGVSEAVVRSLCLYELAEDDPRSAVARDRGVPLVVVGGARVPGHAYVGCDDRGGARRAAEHVLALGHRRIAVVGDHAEPLAGYRDAGIAPVELAEATAVLATSDRLARAVRDRPVIALRRPLRRMGEIAGELLTATGGAAGEVILPADIVVL